MSMRWGSAMTARSSESCSASRWVTAVTMGRNSTDGPAPYQYALILSLRPWNCPPGREARDSPVSDGWGPYLVGYHDDRPGITEQVLSVARDADGRSPYDWLVEAVPPGSATVVDLACGSGPVARLLPGARVVGIDQSAGELAVARAVSPSALLVRARATALPVADGAADAVVSSMALMLLAPLDAVLGEVRRVLRAGGTFAATVPVRSVGAGSVFAEILDALGQSATGYPCDLHTGSLAGRLAAAGLTLEADDTGLFAADDRRRGRRRRRRPLVLRARRGRRPGGGGGGRAGGAAAVGARPARLPHPAAGRRRPTLTGPGTVAVAMDRDGAGARAAVAITGIGAVTPLGDAATTWSRLLAGDSGLEAAPAALRRAGCQVVGRGRVVPGRGLRRPPRWPGAWAGSASSRWRPRSWPWPTPASPATPATGWAWWSTPAPAG